MKLQKQGKIYTTEEQIGFDMEKLIRRPPFHQYGELQGYVTSVQQFKYTDCGSEDDVPFIIRSMRF